MNVSDLQKHRDMIAIALVVIAVTGANLWMTRGDPPLGFEEYEGYGFTLIVPREQSVSDSPATFILNGYWEGGVQSNPGDAGIQVGAYWTDSSEMSQPEYIEYLYGFAEDENSGMTHEPIEPADMGGIEVQRSLFTITAGDSTAYGMVAAFTTVEGRLFAVYAVRMGGDRGGAEHLLTKVLTHFGTTPPTKPRRLESYWPTEGWRFVQPAVLGLDGYMLQSMVDDIMGSGLAVDSVLVVKDGYLVQEGYFNEYGNDVRHNVYSCTKSVVSTLVGIAIERGEIDGVDTRLIDLFPGYAPENVDEWKEAITLRHALMMSAGFDARDSWLYDWEKLGDMHEAEDAVQYILDLPMGFEPGSRFEYTNGVSHLLSCLITEKTGMSAAEYADEHLFGPLGITNYEWAADDAGRNWGYSSLYLRPRDMAKIGYLFLNDGEWDGEQLVSEGWVREATRHRIDANLRDGYGYQWWVDDDG
ncbi:serine hydrolase, partial [Candidatus Bathyarchaeota archaeon]|nr:serine hydrolase [Candidatus Bathyarchaeota archaeon]